MLKQVLAVGAVLWLAGNPRIPATSYQVAEIQARLYFQHDGRFGTQNIVEDAHPTLWNTIIGEGDAKHPSAATLILIKLSGNWLATASLDRPQLRVRVSDGRAGPPLLEQTISLRPFFAEQDSVWVPFIALGTGCGETRISAALVDANGAVLHRLVKTIPFECGE